MTLTNLPSRLSQGWLHFMEPLAQGRFLLGEGQLLLETLRTHQPPLRALPTEVVRWIWLIPFTLHWYGKNLPAEVDEDAFRRLEEDFYAEVSRWLGEP